MVYWSGVLLFYGGYYNESFLDKQQTTLVRKYDFDSQIWTIFQNSEGETISEFGMVVYQDTLFAFQGYSIAEHYWTSVDKLNLTDVSPTWEEVNFDFDDSFPQSAYAMDEHNGTVWFFGGWSTDYEYLDIWNKVMSVDLCKPYTAESELFFELKGEGYDAISPRAGHSLIPVADQLLTFGGRNGATV
jgi:hypothetical protein